MDKTQQWRRACLSPHVIVKLADGEQERRIPSAFLQRSETLRLALAERESAKSSKRRRRNKQGPLCCYNGCTVRMDDVDVPTFELFFEWSMMLHPGLKDSWTVDQVLQLGQLGKTYNVFALKNQVASRLRDCLVSKQWKVTPQLVRHLWQISDGNCDNGLYWILRVSLGAIPNSSDIAAWSTVMQDHPGLYRVHSDACLNKLTLQNLKDVDICVLHDHSWHTEPVGNESKISSIKCPLDGDECYPQGWIDMNEEEGRALCRHHDGGDSTLMDGWEGVVPCDHCGS